MEQFGQYFLLEKIASGGMADIYKAVKIGARGFRKYSAVKKILPHISEDKSIRDMFVKEAHVLSSINHPNIVQIHDLGEEKGQFFIVMDFIKGKDLKTLLLKYQPYEQNIPVELMFFIILSIADGLGYAHNITDSFGKNLNIVHRDVNPNNIFLSYSGEVKIIDFGVVKADTDDNKTKTGIIKGKISYLSPEQLEGKRVDNKTDIFALGLIFYEMFARKKLFDGKTEVETLKQLINLNINEKVDQLGLEKQLADILKKLLCRDETKRYQTAGQFKLDLQKYIRAKGILISAQPLRDCMHLLFADAIESEQKDQAHYDNLITTGVYRTDANGTGPNITDEQFDEKTKFAGNEQPTRITSANDDKTKFVGHGDTQDDEATRFAGAAEEKTKFAPQGKTEIKSISPENNDEATRFVGLDNDKTKFVAQHSPEDEVTRFIAQSKSGADKKTRNPPHFSEPPSLLAVLKRPLVFVPLAAMVLLAVFFVPGFFRDKTITPPVPSVSQDTPDTATADLQEATNSKIVLETSPSTLTSTTAQDNKKAADPAPEKQDMEIITPPQDPQTPQIDTRASTMSKQENTSLSAPQLPITKNETNLSIDSTSTKPGYEKNQTTPSDFNTVIKTPEKHEENITEPPYDQNINLPVSELETNVKSETPVAETRIQTPAREQEKILPEKTKKSLTGDKRLPDVAVTPPKPPPLEETVIKPATPKQDKKDASFVSKNIKLYTLLVVTGNPKGQSLFVGGEEQGNLPITLALPPGFYDIECKLEGYKSYKAGIRIRRGQTLNMQCLLKPDTN